MEAPAKVKIDDFFVGYFAALTAFVEERNQDQLEEKLAWHLVKNYGMLLVSAQLEAKERFRLFLWEEVQKIEREKGTSERSS